MARTDGHRRHEPAVGHQVPKRPRPRYETGDTVYVLVFLDTVSRKRSPTPTVPKPPPCSRIGGGALAAHVEPDLGRPSTRDATNVWSPSSARSGSPSLSTQGAALSYDEAVALVLAELERVIANDDALAPGDAAR